MNSETCTDNRFEVIKYFKEELIQATNIETSPDEMAVLDNLLFRFWQMGWLDKLLLFEPEGMGKDYKGNIGKCNTGRCNTGDYNSGDWNHGDCNSGHKNSGNDNSGESNRGYYNSGNHNIGDCNSGDYNSGEYNSGDWNSGRLNAGHYNIGSRNTGNYNRGDSNTGDYNKTNYSSGCFNTEAPKIYMFNKPSEWTYHDWAYSRARYLLCGIPNRLEYVEFCDMTDTEKEEHPEAKVTGGYLKKMDNPESGVIWWRELSETDKAIIKAIPNFDKEIFKEITGIDVDE